MLVIPTFKCEGVPGIWNGIVSNEMVLKWYEMVLYQTFADFLINAWEIALRAALKVVIQGTSKHFDSFFPLLVYSKVYLGVCV